MQKLCINLIVLSSLFFSCEKNEDSVGPLEDPVVPLSGLSKGAGTAFVTGAESFSYVNYQFRAILQIADRKIGSNWYAEVKVFYGEHGRSIDFEFFIPIQQERRVPPNGDVPLLASYDADPEGRLAAQVSVAGFRSSNLTTGKLTVANSQNAENSFDAIFNLQNLWDDSEEEFVNIEGAFRF